MRKEKEGTLLGALVRDRDTNILRVHTYKEMKLVSRRSMNFGNLKLVYDGQNPFINLNRAKAAQLFEQVLNTPPPPRSTIISG